MGRRDVWDDVFQGEFLMGKSSCADHGSAFLRSCWYLEVDFRWLATEVARREEFTGGRGKSINFLVRVSYLLVTFVCKQQ